MPRELILFCHGKTDTFSTLEKFHRPLRDRCKREAQVLGSWLHQQQLIPDLVLSSSARSAVGAAEHACGVMGLETSIINTNDCIHTADKKTLLKLLAECSDNIQRLLLVGDDPSLEKLLRLLSGNNLKPVKDGKLLPASSLAILHIDTSWSELKPAGASLLSLTRSDQLPYKFPFVNGEHHIEWRQRPAYYYSQSAVIPYRIHKGRTEILLITSSKNKHWIIPKGVIEIGMTAQASAAKEAYEEAGVLGRTGDVLLGTYHHQKWGAECLVQVYPMYVTEMIPQEKRLEPYRQRCWMTPQEAAVCLKQKALLPMIVHLTEQLMLTGSI